MKTEQSHSSTQAFTQFVLCILLAVCPLFSGCAPQPKIAKVSVHEGVYALVSVDGKAVPASVDHGGTTLQVRGGTFTFKADGTCSAKTVFVPPAKAEVTRETTATYLSDGSKVTMRWKGAGRTTGTIEGDTFTMNNEGMLFVYRK